MTLRSVTLVLAALPVLACSAAAPQRASPTSTATPTRAPTAEPHVTAATAPEATTAQTPAATETTAASPDAADIVSIALPPFEAILGAGDDAIWATVYEPASRDIVRIDPATYRITTVLDDLPAQQLHGIGVDGSLWVSNWDTNAVVEYDTTTGQELNSLPVGNNPIEPVLAFGDIWTLDHGDSTVTRIDTATSTVSATIEVAEPGPPGPLTSAVAGGLLWVAAPNTPRVAGIDPTTNRVVRTIELEPDCQPRIGAVAERLWLGGCLYHGADVLDPQTLEPVALRGDIPQTFGAAGEPLVVGDRVWLAVFDPARDLITSLVAADLETFDVVDELELEDVEKPEAVVAFDAMWIGSAGRLIRIPAAALVER